MPSIKCGCGTFYRVIQATMNREGFIPRCRKCRALAALSEENLCIATNVSRGKKRCRHLKSYNSEYCSMHARKLKEQTHHRTPYSRGYVGTTTEEEE